MVPSGILTARSGGWMAQLVRYTIVGTASFLLDLAILSALVEWMGAAVLWSSVVAYLVALFVDYAFSIAWVFSHRRLDGRWLGEFLAFAAIGIAGLGVNTFVMYALADMMGAHYALAKLVAGFCVLLFTFFVRRQTLFTRAKAAAPRAARVPVATRQLAV